MRSSTGQIVFTGSLVNGKKQGKCTWFDEKQRATLEGDFKDDLIEGRGQKKFENGQVYDGEFKRVLKKEEEPLP